MEITFTEQDRQWFEEEIRNAVWQEIVIHEDGYLSTKGACQFLEGISKDTLYKLW